MRIPKTVRVLALVAAGAAAVGGGSCVARQIYGNEPVDKFVKSIECGSIEEPCKNHEIRDFSQALIDNKEILTKKYEISEEDYDLYCKLGIGIAKKESNFGLGIFHFWKKNTPKFSDFCHKHFYGSTNSLSLGLTNIKIEGKETEEKEKFEEFGITPQTIYDPEKAAIATIIHFDTLNKKYHNKYLVNIAPGQASPLTREEYLVALWHGFPPYKKILADRTADKPEDYTWEVLRSLNYSYDPASGSVINNDF